ncbi:hypothetical protein HanXRQr2_Chr15g0694261 [Helianthus annuus]|uniref:Uncharacterized protein n=1 Tax=Helianthus annuus TaxID=4232 RepID=A0A251S9F4_HELAN|nr:hypothetical protein HanXRQr2_Chr15g0694261 [Helianthus annuus]
MGFPGTIGTQWELAWRRIVVGQGLLQDYVKLETFGTYVITLNLCFRLQLNLFVLEHQSYWLNFYNHLYACSV